MSRPQNPVPSYRLHKSSGQAVVTLRLPDGQRKDMLLGKYNSEESKAEYLRIIKEWQTSGGRPPTSASGPSADITVNELLVAFLRHAERYYVDADGEPTKELPCLRDAIRLLRKIYGYSRAVEFGPLALKTVRQAMVDAGLARTVCNARTNRIRRVFKWAASEELIPFVVFQSLTTVRGFGRGRSNVRETEPVLPVDPLDVEATIPHLPPAPAAMARLQLLTGMRPGEAIRLRALELDTTGEVWVYTPSRHKTAYRGRSRLIYIGPKGQELLAPWLAKAGDGYVFSPARERGEHLTRLRSARQSKVQPSQACRKRAKPKKLPGERYTSASYCRAIRSGVEKANRKRAALPEGFVGPPLPPIPHWHPNRIRHTFGTDVRKRFGLEAAQVLLGHARADVTQVYAERDQTLALRVAAELG